MRPGVAGVAWCVLLAMTLACKSREPGAPATSAPVVIDAAVVDATVVDAAVVDATVVDATVVDAAVVDAFVIDAAVMDTGANVKAKPRKKSRAKCLEDCNRRNMHTDCADEEGGMAPCPCHCD